MADTQEEIKPEVKMDETEPEEETQPEAKEETMPEAEQEESKAEAKEGEEKESKEEIDEAPVETPKDEEMKEESKVVSNPSTPMLADEEVNFNFTYSASPILCKSRRYRALFMVVKLAVEKYC